VFGLETVVSTPLFPLGLGDELASKRSVVQLSVIKGRMLSGRLTREAFRPDVHNPSFRNTDRRTGLM
jgi:hypothetical protein